MKRDKYRMSAKIRIAQLDPQADAELILSTLRHPTVYPHIRDDATPPPAELQVSSAPSIGYLGAWDSETFMGLWVVDRRNAVTIEVHICFLPLAAGSKGLEVAKAGADWVWANTDFVRIVTSVPVFNNLAIRFAERIGMQRYGENQSSFLKDGELHNEILLGLSRPRNGGDSWQQRER